MNTLLLLNGGLGRRFESSAPKQFFTINQVPLFIYSLREAVNIEGISRILTNYPEKWEELFLRTLEEFGLKDKVEIIKAGKSRQESVLGLLELAMGDDNESVILHEAARPTVKQSDYETLINHPEANVGFGMPISFTVLELDDNYEYVSKKLERKKLVNVQLPQKFNKVALWDAHNQAKAEGSVFTDDASLFFHYGGNFRFINGNNLNFKVTQPMDANLVELFLNEKNKGI